jgi:hypothetical protein
MSTLAFIHRFEAGTRPEARPLLLLHGTGGDENDLVPLGRAIAPDAVTQQRRWRGSDLVMGIARSMCGLATAGGTRHHLDLRAGLHLRDGGVRRLPRLAGRSDTPRSGLCSSQSCEISAGDLLPAAP